MPFFNEMNLDQRHAAGSHDTSLIYSVIYEFSSSLQYSPSWTFLISYHVAIEVFMTKLIDSHGAVISCSLSKQWNDGPFKNCTSTWELKHATPAVGDVDKAFT